jgi:hypothetical protein
MKHGEQQGIKGQKGTWEGNKVVKCEGMMKHHTQQRCTKEEQRSNKNSEA